MPTKVRKTAKPGKPNVDKDFPLWLHPSGRWCRKIKGRFHYFGKADDPQAALEEWIRVKDDLLAGRVRRPKGQPEGLELDALVNLFLQHKLERVMSGEIRQSTFDEYCRILRQFLDYFGRHRLALDITPQDFEGLRSHLAKTAGIAELGKRVQVIRSTYKWAFENDHLDRVPKFGTFKQPSAKVKRRARGQRVSRMFTPDELQTIMGKASVPVKAQILLALNCGFGQSDISALPVDALDLDGGFVTFPRVKTGVERRCPLWAETIEALRATLAVRTKPVDPADKNAVFLTKYGRRWVRYQPSTKRENGGTWIDAVNLQFRKALRAAGIDRSGAGGFYALRHVHRTIADRAGDPRACAVIMGHMDENDMAGRYIEQVDDDRLVKVVGVVHAWLFSSAKRTGKRTTTKAGKTHKRTKGKGKRPALRLVGNG